MRLLIQPGSFRRILIHNHLDRISKDSPDLLAVIKEEGKV